MSSGVTAQGTSADGQRRRHQDGLVDGDPLATAQTTGSSRSAATPVTCWAFSARSSPSTPAVFFAATLDSSATSSSRRDIVQQCQQARCHGRLDPSVDHPQVNCSWIERLLNGLALECRGMRISRSRRAERCRR